MQVRQDFKRFRFLVPTETKPASLVKKRVISEIQEHFIVEQVI